MTLIYANTVFDELNMEGLSQEKREQKIDGFIYNMERLMGMEEGSLQDTIRKVF